VTLAEPGLSTLWVADQASLRRTAQDELQDRVIRRMTASMTEEQLTVFNAAHDIDPVAARTILDEMVPNQDVLLDEELKRLQDEIRDASEEITRELAIGT
jgi:hypothetical protein